MKPEELPNWFKEKYKEELKAYKDTKYQDGEWWIELGDIFKLLKIKQHGEK